jgi:hypothetical protein
MDGYDWLCVDFDVKVLVFYSDLRSVLGALFPWGL